MKAQPPRLAEKLLLRFLKRELAEEVLGDLDEKFYSSLKTHSLWRARLNYWYQVINYLRPFALKRSRSTTNNIDMFKSYITIAWRNLERHKMYSAINIGGFAVGMAACLLLFVYVNGELSYDKFYKNQDRLYRITSSSRYGEYSGSGVHFAHPFADAVKQVAPEVEAIGSYNSVVNFGAGSGEVRRSDRNENAHEEGLVYADQGLIDVLEVPFLYGDATTALKQPRTVVITESKSVAYFGYVDPTGKELVINNNVKEPYTVTGVIRDFSEQSHINFEFFLTLEGKVFFEGERDSWCCNNYISYVRTRPGADLANLEEKIRRINEDKMTADPNNANPDATTKAWLKSFRFYLQPLPEIYLNKDIHDDLEHGDIRFIWLFGSIAGFILILACINFINLSTARSATRAREVGVRKAVGSLRSALIRQFLTESFLFALIALVIACGLVLLTMPLFNQLIGKQLHLPTMQWWVIPGIVAAAILIGTISGLYPAFYLSSFRPAKVLKSGMSGSGRNPVLRSTLVVVQFTISSILIVGTIVISRQMNFMLDKELGFEKEGVIVLNGTKSLDDQIVSFKQDLLQIPEVQSATISSYLPVHNGKSDGGDTWLEGTQREHEVQGKQWLVDHDYVKTMGFTIVEGRDFDFTINSDSKAMIVNETFARQLAVKKTVGTRVTNYGGSFTIIGVVKDFHFRSLQENITPVSMFISRSRGIVSVKTSSNDMQATLEKIAAVWKKFSPNQPIRYEFLDDRYAMTYDDVNRFSKIITVFATLAIVIACLGLFALSAFTIEQRGKEISIRLILGAPMRNILRLLTQNFVGLILISFAIAIPIAWFTMNTWLQNYAYKVDVGIDIFLIAAASVTAIALVTISYQSLRASLANPVDKLKSE